MIVLLFSQGIIYIHRGALRGTPNPNATELPSCAPISTRAAQRRRRRRWWRGEEGARRPGPEGQVLRHVLWHVLRNALCCVVHVLVFHIQHPSLSSFSYHYAGARSTGFCAIWDCISSSSSSNATASSPGTCTACPRFVVLLQLRSLPVFLSPPLCGLDLNDITLAEAGA